MNKIKFESTVELWRDMSLLGFIYKPTFQGKWTNKVNTKGNLPFFLKWLFLTALFAPLLYSSNFYIICIGLVLILVPGFMLALNLWVLLVLQILCISMTPLCLIDDVLSSLKDSK
ncbi:hypothetical protein [Microcoleus sp. S13_C5]|uniref:hypothetical protein n=1 Tax=Microcoleus sp. S13_C5 TaxID=3055411 RepID=UPI002FD5DD63